MQWKMYLCCEQIHFHESLMYKEIYDKKIYIFLYTVHTHISVRSAGSIYNQVKK